MMRFRLIGIALFLFLLTGCRNEAGSSIPADGDDSGLSADIVYSEDDTSTVMVDTLKPVSDTYSVQPVKSSTEVGTLEYLREQAAREGCLCAIAEIGYVKKDEDIKSVIADSEVTAQYPFLASTKTISVYSGQVYAIVPTDPNGTIQIEEIQFGGSDGFQTVVKSDGFHYSREAEPLILCCSETDFIGTVWVTITDSNGRSVRIEPYHNLRDGYLLIPYEVYDFTPYADEIFLEFVLAEIDDPNVSDSWYDGDFDFSTVQAERLILGLRAMGWSMHKIIHFLNYVAYGDEAHLDYVGPTEEVSP